MTSRKYRQTTLSFPTKPANIHSDCSTPSIDTGQPVVFPGSHNDIFWVNKALPELDQNDCNSYIKFNLSRVAVPEGVPTDLRNLNEVDILVRVVLVELIHSIKSKTRFRTILRGPGGAGKSTSLLLLQKAAKELGMVVAYIPQGNSFGSNVTAAQINSFCLTWLKAFVSGNRQILEKISKSILP